MVTIIDLEIFINITQVTSTMVINTYLVIVFFISGITVRFYCLEKYLDFFFIINITFPYGKYILIVRNISV